MKRILLIEDDCIFRYLNRRVLRGLGFEDKQIDFALNGNEALEGLKESYGRNQTMPDIILLDLRMPIINGFDFIRAVRNMIGMDKVRIVIVTSSLNPDDMERAFELGVYYYLNKPLQADELAEVLHLNREKQLEDYRQRFQGWVG